MSDDWLIGQYNTVGHYTMAAICLRGHVVTADVGRFGEAVTKFCTKCGAQVVTKCSACGTPIHGHFVPPGVSGIGAPLRPPAHCHECGKAYSWTEAKIAAARELVDELEEIGPEDRIKLKTAITDISTAGPQAEVGAIRINKLIGKATSAVGQALWKAAVDIATEAAKKTLLGVRRQWCVTRLPCPGTSGPRSKGPRSRAPSGASTRAFRRAFIERRHWRLLRAACRAFLITLPGTL
jgi:hypothetical protein